MDKFIEGVKDVNHMPVTDRNTADEHMNIQPEISTLQPHYRTNAII